MSHRRTLLAAVALASAAAAPMTADQDHQRTMDQLHITSVRRGADGNDPTSAHAANYDEAKANPFPKLPDVLKLDDGRPVTTPDGWWHQRRPQIVEDFDREVYGRVPADVPAVTWEVLSTTPDKVGPVAVVTKKLVGHVDNAADPAITVDIELTLTTPADAAGPVPVIMEFGFTFPAGGRFGRRPATRPGGPHLAIAGAGQGLGVRRSRPRPASRPTTGPA